MLDVATLASRVQVASSGTRIAGTFVGAFGLLRAGAGGGGNLRRDCLQRRRERTHEIGIRIALGASKEEILRLVLWHGMRLTLIGVGLGLAAAFALTRFLGSMLLGVTSTDALTFSSVAILLCGVVLLASLIPARRAMRVDPMVALRYE